MVFPDAPRGLLPLPLWRTLKEDMPRLWDVINSVLKYFDTVLKSATGAPFGAAELSRRGLERQPPPDFLGIKICIPSNIHQDNSHPASQGRRDASSGRAWAISIAFLDY
jgi:hypothetical protein